MRSTLKILRKLVDRRKGVLKQETVINFIRDNNKNDDNGQIIKQNNFENIENDNKGR